MLSRMGHNSVAMHTLSEPSPREELALSCYGVEFRLVDDTGAGLCSRLRAALPPEFVDPSVPGVEVISYKVAPEISAGSRAVHGYRVTCNGVTVESFDVATEDSALELLLRNIDHTISRRSYQGLFVHAGVVGWRGLAIVIPGRSLTGKTTLVSELVRLGAMYYSDEFAVLDDSGYVHPYRRPLVLRDEVIGTSHDLRLQWEGMPAEPLPIGLIVVAPYQPGATWRPNIIRSARAVLPIIEGAVLARQESARILRIAARIAPRLVTLQGVRPEATETAAQLLELVDDALVSQALASEETLSDGGAANLAAVAEKRLRSEAGRPAPARRQLVAAGYVRIPDFLSHDEHQRLLDHAIANQDAFLDSEVLTAHGKSQMDYGFRKSRTLFGPEVEKIWELFDERLHGLLPFVRRELGLSWFPLGRVERQLTAHSHEGFFAPHRDTGHAETADRRISCVYYFHSNPQCFTGGDLRLYDNWVTDRGSSAAASYTTLTPLDNSIVFFRSDTFHEVRAVHRESEEFRDSRFAMTIWFREGKWPDRMPGTETH
jgi:Rps23 Pro-64 3,4-dihydroxylase Tpa1-like proline 4-hydroxylase